MRFFVDTPLLSASRRLVSSLQPWMTRQAQVKTGVGSLLAISNFDADNEQLFWQERQAETLSSLKWALMLGMFGFLGFIVLDFQTTGLSAIDLLARSLIVAALFVLYLHLQKHPQPMTRIATTAKLGAGFSILNLAGTVLTAHDPLFYPEIWSGLLPIYFFIYGQLFMTILETMIFGWLAMLVLPLSAYLIGTETRALIPSLLILLIVNLFGLCTRCQMERHSRRAFQARRKAETAVKEKNLFLQHLSHNLRQPLQALSCYSSVLEVACAEPPASNLQNIAGRMGYAIDELNKSFNHILHIANLEAGTQQPSLKAVDINVLLNTLEEQFAPLAAKHGIVFKVIFRARPPYNVYSDACILGQVIGNLIDNAIKYTRQGWIVVRAVKIGGNRLKLHVCDTGIGITEQQKQNIFENFYRGARRRDDPPIHGLGIGLAYVLKAVETLPGHALSYYSKANVGSDFNLLLPVCHQSVFAETAVKTQANLAGNFIFIVDDDAVILEALAQQLRSCGCLVQTAASQAETLSMLADNLRVPDLLICDFYLDNQETAHDIISLFLAEYGAVPTLVLSAHAISSQDKDKWPDNTLLLRKPATSALLMETILKAMGKQR